MKFPHAIIQEIERYAEYCWNASKNNDGRPDYKWLADYSVTKRPLAFRINDQQRFYLEGLASNLPMEDVQTIIELFRRSVDSLAGPSVLVLGTDQLVAVMADVIDRHMDYVQRTKLLRPPPPVDFVPKIFLPAPVQPNRLVIT